MYDSLQRPCIRDLRAVDLRSAVEHDLRPLIIHPLECATRSTSGLMGFNGDLKPIEPIAQ